MSLAFLSVEESVHLSGEKSREREAYQLGCLWLQIRKHDSPGLNNKDILLSFNTGSPEAEQFHSWLILGLDDI